MRRVVHLSDLHFGRTDPGLLEPLLEAVNAARPQLVAISGDFTQRARVAQFEAAAAFVARIAAPVLSVPGNHDTPLDNLFLRVFAPWRRYRAHIDPVLEPEFRDAELIALGVNTVNRFAWQQGRMPSRAIARTRAAFAGAGTATRIVVLHHPLEETPGARKPVMREAARSLDGFSEAGAEIVLSGHLHSTHLAPFTRRPGLLFVQAGTLSTRLRGGEASFNILDLTPGAVEIAAMTVDEAGLFHAGTRAVFRKGPDGWLREEIAPPSPELRVPGETPQARAAGHR